VTTTTQKNVSERRRFEHADCLKAVVAIGASASDEGGASGYNARSTSLGADARAALAGGGGLGRAAQAAQQVGSRRVRRGVRHPLFVRPDSRLR
jgi:hypothetical protein